MTKRQLLTLSMLLSGIGNAQAVPEPPLPPLHNVEISGTVTFAGKPVANIQLEILGDGCASSLDIIAQTRTDQRGYYRVFLSTAPYSALIATNGYKSGKRNPAYDTDCQGNGLSLQAHAKNRHDISLKKALPPSPEEQECLTAGGHWEQMNGFKGCNTYFSDGGKSCTDGTQCVAEVCIIQRVGGTMGYDAGFCPINTYAKNSSTNIMRNGRIVSTTAPTTSGSWWFQQVPQ